METKKDSVLKHSMMQHQTMLSGLRSASSVHGRKLAKEGHRTTILTDRSVEETLNERMGCGNSS